MLRDLQIGLVRAGLDVVDSYVSITELSEYALGLPAEMADMRLNPKLPPPGKPAWCFYPMTKRRNVGQNWYELPFEERKELMYEHGASGRKFAGRIVQLVTASTGLDDWEWGGHPVRRGSGRPQGDRLHHALRPGLRHLRRVRPVRDRHGRPSRRDPRTDPLTPEADRTGLSAGFEQAWERAADVEGWLTPEQGRKLFDAARGLGPGASVVEIGSFRGRSMIVLAQAAPDDASVVAIDPHGGGDRGPGEIAPDAARGDADHAAFVANLAAAGVADRVRHVRKLSADAMSDVDGRGGPAVRGRRPPSRRPPAPTSCSGATGWATAARCWFTTPLARWG